MKTKDLLALPIEERAKQKPEKRWEQGCVFLAIFVVSILLFIIVSTHAKGFDFSGIIIYTTIVGAAGAYGSFRNYKQTQINIIADAVREIKQKKKNQELQSVLNNRLDELSKKHGVCDKQIQIASTTEIESYILVYGTGKCLVINNREIDFSDIIDLSVQDEQEVQKGKMHAVTTTDTSSMVGRAVVGGVLMGSTGADIGGATARKDTTFVQENDKVIHSYTAIVNLNNISDPIIAVNIGSDISLANEVKALFKVILNSK